MNLNMILVIFFALASAVIIAILATIVFKQSSKIWVLLDVVIVCGVVLAIIYSVTTSDSNKVKVDSKSKSILETAVKNLKSYDKDYIISNTLNAPDGTTNYLIVKSGDISYSEYPINSNGEIGKIDENSDNINYTLVDWLTKDKYYYVVSDDEGNSQFTYLPKGYIKTIGTRNYLYMDIMLDKFTSIKKKTSSEFDFGDGTEKITIYECSLGSDDARDVLGVNTLKLYESIQKKYKSDKIINKFCKFYIDDLKTNLTCSDAKVYVGVSDKSKMLRYVGIEVGGLGTKLSYTMTVNNNTEEVRTEPEGLSNAVDYVDSIREYAQAVTKYDSYSDAMENIYSETDGLEDLESETAVESESIEDTSEAASETSSEVTSEVESESSESETKSE